MKVDIWHNILWSRYKAEVFAQLHAIASHSSIGINFFQIAETERDRRALSPSDSALHKYPYRLLFTGAYSDIPLITRLWRIGTVSATSQADLAILVGFNKIEYWLQLVLYKMRGKRVGLFCDSTRYDNPYSLPKQLAKQLFLAQIDLVYCYGERARMYVSGLGVPDHKIITRCQAASLPATYNADQIPAARRHQRAQTSSRRIFLYVGRLAPEKDLGTLIRAFHSFYDAQRDDRLVLVGAGPLEADLRALSASLGLSPETVHFMGPLNPDQLREEYLRATALVLPSLSEPWGLVVNEALAYGCPVVVSDRCGCVPELVIPGKTGFVFPSGDASSLASAMQEVATLASSIDSVTEQCLATVAPYTPHAAAYQIFQGLRQLDEIA